jgi:hypothetical protein
MRFTPSKVNDGKILVFVDLSEINYKPLPTRSPAGHHPVTATLKARIEALQAELAKVEALAAVQRADFERERADRLMTELLRATADTLAAKEAAARLDGELSALRSRPWWPRMVWAEAALLPVRHPGGRVGCNRSSKPVAQCIPAAGRLSMMGVVCPGSARVQI